MKSSDELNNSLSYLSEYIHWQNPDFVRMPNTYDDYEEEDNEEDDNEDDL